MATVESSTNMPTASASPPRVMVLMVWPSAESTAMEVRIESGIETITIKVERQDPRKIRIIMAVSPAAISASRSTLLIAWLTKIDWSKSRLIFMPGGAAARISGIAALTRFTTSRVEASPFLMIVSSTARRPSARTMFC